MCSAGGRTPATCTFCLQSSQTESRLLTIAAIGFHKTETSPTQGELQSLSYIRNYIHFFLNPLGYKRSQVFSIRSAVANGKHVYLKQNIIY